MRLRLTVALLAAATALLAAAPGASAHPLGNFTINHLARVSISADRVDVAYTLDQAEIPTFQERGLSPAAVLERKRAEVRRRLVLTVEGHHVPLALEPGGRVSFPAGQGGLHTTRVELSLTAAVRDGRRVELRDGTFPGRLGWRSIVAGPGAGTDVRSSVPARDPTGGLRHYPADLLRSPLDQRSAAFAVEPGNGRLTAPHGEHAGGGDASKSGDGFAGIFADAASGHGVLILLLLAAFGWGAVHALSPGHGKSMVAAYLVGTRGTARHAAALGATVTITHTIGVFALGGVTLALSQYVLPEDLYPWLTLVAGLLVLAVGAGVLRARIRSAQWAMRSGRAGRGALPAAHCPPDHAHTNDRNHGHSHAHTHDHQDLRPRTLVALGASAGLIPCPSALVVLLAAVAQHQVALGLLLIVAFSLGLAATITAIGVAVVYAGRVATRMDMSGRVATALPAISALVIVAVGCVLTAQAVPNVFG
jgi:ABC-type nickel/cobalt efflux system permease component RcnA